MKNSEKLTATTAAASSVESNSNNNGLTSQKSGINQNVSISANGANTSGERRIIYNMPSFIEYDGLRFLVMDAPNDQNLPTYLKVC